jgi:hypothetical protein
MTELDDDTFTNSAQFYEAVRRLRALPLQFQATAFYVALCWSDETIADAELRHEIPGSPDEVLPLPCQRPGVAPLAQRRPDHLRLVT